MSTKLQHRYRPTKCHSGHIRLYAYLEAPPPRVSTRQGIHYHQRMTHGHQEASGGTEDKSLLHMSMRVKLHPSTPSPCSSLSWFPPNLSWHPIIVFCFSSKDVQGSNFSLLALTRISRSRRFQWHHSCQGHHHHLHHRLCFQIHIHPHTH